MLSKRTVIKTITSFPEKFTVDELVDKMILLDKIENGIKEADANHLISDEDVDK